MSVDVLGFGIVWVVLSILGEMGVRVIIHNDPMYYTASNIGLMVESAMDFLIVVLVPIFIFVGLTLVWSMIRFTVKRGETPTLPEKFARSNKWFVGSWVIGSIGINLLFFLHPTASATEQFFAMENPQAAANKQAIIVDVTARQWEWIFSYPQYGLTQTLDANGQDQLELPVGRSVKFVLRSYDPYHTYDQYVDVIHSFWVPSWGIKEDVIPGEARSIYITPTKITSFAQNPMSRVQCAEVCGPGHPWMEAPLNVVSSSQFAKWIQYEKKLQSGLG
ncbi:cytochrome c oxidase subunit II [Sulfobacillus sp. hq2]|uniref:cytochrome c oxidase subunit II n=1 Tax=Sulfobacillus TaxID=28033 RepID=UPI001FA8DE7B|nr:cytochrome c oxidase subunit II [Sulfobacillus sp. hq2]